MSERDAEGLLVLLVYGGMGLAIAGCFVWGWMWKRRQRPRIERARRAAAAALGGEFAMGAITFEVGGRAARVDFAEPGFQREAYTLVSVDLRGASPGALHVVPRDPPGTMRVLGVLIMSGTRGVSPGFDELYTTASTPPSVAESFFAEPRRDWVIQTFRSLERLGEPALEISRERLLLRVHRDLQDERAIRQLATVAGVLYEHVADAVPAGVAWMEAGAGADPRCGVCMTAVEASVACVRCRAPHHRECWEFAGLCATFACGSRQWA